MPTSKEAKKAKAKNNTKSDYPDSLFNPSIPYACSEEEYEDLLRQASSLSYKEAQQELLDCARYGETDAVCAILAKSSSTTYEKLKEEKEKIGDREEKTTLLIDTADSYGNTALHKSCANGHDPVVALLLHHKAQFLPNESGNTPLHWAAANGHEKCVELLVLDPLLNKKSNKKDLCVMSQIDVLQKNRFGRSALTEGFSSQNTKVVGLLLEHDSAEEERLIGGKDQKKNNETLRAEKEDTNGTDEDQGEDESKKTEVIHEFLFVSNDVAIEKNPDYYHDIVTEDGVLNSIKTLLIRELPIAHADNPFGEKPEDDTTGLSIWCASLVMSRWMASPSIYKRFDGKSILELGAGCAVPGLTVALYSKAKSIFVTDIHPLTVQNIQYNIQLNEKSPSFQASQNRIHAKTINWDDESTWPTSTENKVDFILGSDLIYQSSIVPHLTKVIRGLLSDEGSFFYVAPEGGRDGLSQFIDEMKTDGFFQSVKEKVAPPEYTMNPLKSQDEEDYFLLFNELASTTYVLYEFSRMQKTSGK